MITRTEMIPTLMASCPGFAPRNSEFLTEWQEDAEPAHYLLLAEFARYLITLLEEGQQSDLEAAFTAIERLHTEGDAYVREAATIGILESLQNTNLHSHTKPEQFAKFLRPESLRFWHKVEDFWKDGTIITDD